MQQFLGRAISPGYAEGTAYVYGKYQVQEIPHYEIASTDVPREHCRFHEALEHSVRELKQLEERVLVELGRTESAIFSAHLGLLQDQGFAERIKTRIERDLVNVEHALSKEMADLCQMLASVESEYIRERAQDIRDVGMRVMRQLDSREGGRYLHLPPRSVIVAHELLPSETLDLDRKHVVAIVTELGGENSHAAILARALGIPAVTGIPAATSSIATGWPVLVDGERGAVSVMPNQEAIARFATRKSHYDHDTSMAAAAESLASVTQDGTPISLLANINRPDETSLIAPHHLEGVGLFRTEFMFLDSPVPPSFEVQSTTYSQVIQSLGDHPINIRTLDLGGDKLPAFLEHKHKANPSLAARGLRFSLAERTLFETQLRAIMAATQGNPNTRILLPMVLGEGDCATAADVIRSISSELGRAQPPPIGAMIETPAALFALDEILEIADFVCIGTNDLTQFMLAADRNTIEIDAECSVLHPSVLRAIAKVVDAGRSAGCDVTVCGEAASYPRTACLLVGLGVRRISMSPVRAARVRYRLRKMHLGALEEGAEKALKCNSATEVRKVLEE